MDQSFSMDYLCTPHLTSFEESYSASVDYDKITGYFPELDDTMLEPGLLSSPIAFDFTIAGMIDPAFPIQHQDFGSLPNDAPPMQHH
jgi:hypothetical protein